MTITHEVLRGVTPEMLRWWFLNIDGTMTYAGKTYPRHLVMHPPDHIDIRVERHPSNGNVSRVWLTEAFGLNPKYLVRVDGLERFLFGTTGGSMEQRVLGILLFQLSPKNL